MALESTAPVPFDWRNLTHHGFVLQALNLLDRRRRLKLRSLISRISLGRRFDPAAAETSNVGDA